MNLDELLAAIGSTPKLTGEACRGHHELFDDSGDQTQALALCRQCPALTACAQWLAGLPRSRRPHGVRRRASAQRQSAQTTRPVERWRTNKPTLIRRTPGSHP